MFVLRCLCSIQNVVLSSIQLIDVTLQIHFFFFHFRDVEPFLEATKNLTKYYEDRGVDIMKQAISVPGVSQRLAFNTVTDRSCFFLFNKRHKDLVKLFFRNNTGGPSLIFNRYMEAGRLITQK